MLNAPPYIYNRPIQEEDEHDELVWDIGVPLFLSVSAWVHYIAKDFSLVVAPWGFLYTLVDQWGVFAWREEARKFLYFTRHVKPRKLLWGLYDQTRAWFVYNADTRDLRLQFRTAFIASFFFFFKRTLTFGSYGLWWIVVWIRIFELWIKRQ